MPEVIEFPTKVHGQNAYAYYYPPTNPIYQASKDEKPPLLLKSHGMFIVLLLFDDNFLKCMGKNEEKQEDPLTS